MTEAEITRAVKVACSIIEAIPIEVRREAARRAIKELRQCISRCRAGKSK